LRRDLDPAAVRGFMTAEQRTLLQGLHDISKMIILAAEMHRQHTRLLVVLLEAGANTTDIVAEMRANEEMFAGYLTRIGALAETLRLAFSGPRAEATP
jgi:hypothetical protein